MPKVTWLDLVDIYYANELSGKELRGSIKLQWARFTCLDCSSMATTKLLLHFAVQQTPSNHSLLFLSFQELDPRNKKINMHEA